MTLPSRAEKEWDERSRLLIERALNCYWKQVWQRDSIYVKLDKLQKFQRPLDIHLMAQFLRKGTKFVPLNSN
ncbi:MAG: hypothetical protein SW833_14095 [Cyanobacteriota bacterium]|nr:hypothetical protein [Cyanobacteriota bacterium]